VNGNALSGFDPIVKLCVAGAAPLAVALNESALTDAVNVVAGVAAEIPVPPMLIVIWDPLPRVNVNDAAYACAAAGLNVTDAVKLWCPLKVMGNAGPEYENAADDRTAL